MKMEMANDMKAIKVDRLSDIRKLYQRNVIPTYARFDLALDYGDRSYDRNNSHNFGWIGLLGLAGLTGLFRRNHGNDVRTNRDDARVNPRV